jgi:CO/xanthine dehydrogenase Mo-binding subunit
MRELPAEVDVKHKLIQEEKDIIGESVVREDAVPKVTGKAIYGADLYKPGMLHGKVLLSTEAHALVKHIDTREAERMDGVHAVLTAKDIPGANVYGIAIPDQQVLAEERVRFYGEPVALVAAEEPDLAEEALSKIHVEYEPLPPVFNPISALEPEAPQVQPNGNLILRTRVRKGDCEKGFEEADVVIEDLFRTHGQDHAPIEPEAGIAWIDENGTLVIFSSSQYIFRDRRQVAQVLKLPANRIRSIASEMGGGFGRKDDVTVEILVALLAWKTGRPVRLAYTRHESMLTQTHRHPTVVRARAGATRDGKLTALEGVIYGDSGAYASLGIYVIKKMALHLGGPYYWPNYKTDSFSVYTNNPIGGPFRGFGVLQCAVVHESLLDRLAETIGMDPIEFRLNNCLREGLTFSTGQVMTEAAGIAATLEKLKEYMADEDLSFNRHSEVTA